ncbi:MAG: TatD family hydrolase [Defluviitaleaceae bacterium]|nr:TatD family hydrolase [Defluviitaleaceae bacterium]
MVFFDSHAHYDFDSFDSDRDELLSSLPRSGIDAIVNVGAGVMSSYRSVKLARQYEYIYASAGVHPHYVNDMTDSDLEKIRKLATDDRCVAVGEIGFDYHYKRSTLANQRKWFGRQLELAKELDRPVIIHSRDASADTLDMLRSYNITRGVVHCFSDDENAAIAYVSMGLYIGIGGVVTFPNTAHVARAVQAVGVSKILLETDCPYLSPDPLRGRRNDSRNLEHICVKVASLLKTNAEDVANITNYNARMLFGLGI